MPERMYTSSKEPRTDPDPNTDVLLSVPIKFFALMHVDLRQRVSILLIVLFFFLVGISPIVTCMLDNFLLSLYY